MTEERCKDCNDVVSCHNIGTALFPYYCCSVCWRKRVAELRKDEDDEK